MPAAAAGHRSLRPAPSHGQWASVRAGQNAGGGGGRRNAPPPPPGPAIFAAESDEPEAQLSLVANADGIARLGTELALPAGTHRLVYAFAVVSPAAASPRAGR
jgi:hypothetical protein